MDCLYIDGKLLVCKHMARRTLEGRSRLTPTRFTVQKKYQRWQANENLAEIAYDCRARS